MPTTTTAATDALAEAVAEFDQLAEDEQQLGLFSEPATQAGRAKAKVVSIAERRVRGKGKRTEATVALLLSRYRDPRAIALERIQMHPADLAGVLQCSIADAEDRQRLWAVAVMPFLHARITPEVLDNRQVIYLTIGGFEAGAGGGGPAVVQVLDPSEFAPVADASSADPLMLDGANAGDLSPATELSHTPSHKQGA